MDVEGYEYEIIKGMKGMLELIPKDGILNFEIHPPFIRAGRMSGIDPIIDMFDTLKKHGFRPMKYTPARDGIADITDMEELRKKVGVEYCSHMFFEKI